MRRPPRGVPKAEFAKRDYYDVWLPELSPSAATVSAAMAAEWTEKSWKKFVATYVREMSTPAAEHLIAALAALSHQTNFSVGCYCEHENHCHRSILRQLLTELGAIFKTRTGGEWETQLRAAGVACVVAARAPVESHYMDKGDVGEQCGMITTAHHPILDEIPRLAPLIRFSRSATVAGDAGLCGQETNKVLAEYGYSEAELAQLAADKIIMQL